MRVQVLFFAGLQDRVGIREQEYVLKESSTLRDLQRRLDHEFPDLAFLFRKARIAVNEEYASSDEVLSDGDRVALIPPVSGG